MLLSDFFRNLITSLRCLPEYGVLISGCKDGRVNIWDVSTFKIIRLLGTHSSEIMDIKACWITGDIFVASSRQISVYSINGDPLGLKATFCGNLFVVFRLCADGESRMYWSTGWPRVGTTENGAIRAHRRIHTCLGTGTRSLSELEVRKRFLKR